ncbi:zinc dependent phospholipase C family protein [Methylobacillus gramineus]|uniref:zinc dependent phospholipase C family protein n=1 Tax=Methylobacillus gramineus TaxID=755169 RepID=UPI001CFFC5A7|nr:zinc dependent phospholipase C family protein [Methylobacillus gramineus]MCB5184870.1 zinc dependent phospholipase C family protein [Methylobacillus gramineus]
MTSSKLLQKMCWLAPFASFSTDAQAWGLVTHVYFAQSLLWAMPLLDPRLQAAIRRFPELVMAGACLPDLAIVSRRFGHTHYWENAHQLLASAHTDEETAIAIGYASHLYIDVIAHNHFVPAHEAMWMANSMITHIGAEWAMDAYLVPLIDSSPGTLLRKHRDCISRFIAPQFNCSQQQASNAMMKLAHADHLLRFSRLPNMIYHGMRMLDKRLFRNFAFYIARTQTALNHIGTMLQGDRPLWEPELNHITNEQMQQWRKRCLIGLKRGHASPIDYFSQ